MANLIDRALAGVAPRLALRRVSARAKLKRYMEPGASSRFGWHSNGFEGASRGRRTGNWLARHQDANAVLRGALPILRARSRDLARNNPWASSGVATLETFVVGRGIELQPEGTGRVADAANALWRTWSHSTDCDSTGCDDLGGIQALAVRTIVESGSVLIRRRLRRTSDGLAVPLQLQVLEPDHLDLERTKGNGENRVIHGVEYDLVGRVAAYWLYPDHPGDDHPRARRTVSRRVPAEEVAHVFLKTRPGQVQGVPWLTSAMLRARNLDEFEDAELLRMAIASNWAGFVTTETDPEVDDVGPNDEKIEDVQPGAIEYLRPGESIEFPQLPKVDGRDSYVSWHLRAIAASLQVPYEALTGDLTKVNFSSGRMGFNAFERRVAVWQRRMMVNALLRRVWGWFVEAAMASLQLPASAAELTTTWTPPSRTILDPEKDEEADKAAVRNGTKTLFEVLRSRGRDPRAHLEEASAAFEMLDELGLTLDLDPRRVAPAGAAATGGDEGAPDEDESGGDSDVGDDDAGDDSEPDADE
ncbi:MAG: phage portal protein [Planctomycetota bacterium]